MSNERAAKSTHIQLSMERRLPDVVFHRQTFPLRKTWAGAATAAAEQFQETSQIQGYMGGRVTDAEYHPLQGALIVAQHTGTKEQFQTASRPDGQFELSIPFGEYKVTISLKGYMTVTGICHARKEEGCFIEFGNRMQKAPN